MRLGAPNDEALHGHPLEGKGLQFYAAHEVRNSRWLAEHIRINSAHPRHSDEPWRRLHHYSLAFHGEIFEAIAAGIDAKVVRSPLRPLLEQLTRELVDRPHQMTSPAGDDTMRWHDPYRNTRL